MNTEITKRLFNIVTSLPYSGNTIPLDFITYLHTKVVQSTAHLPSSESALFDMGYPLLMTNFPPKNEGLYAIEQLQLPELQSFAEWEEYKRTMLQSGTTYSDANEAEYVLKASEHYDTRKGLNRNPDVIIPQDLIDRIESGDGVDIEVMDDYDVEVFKYKTQITIHGIFKDISNTRVGGYKRLIPNKNGSLGVKYEAIDYAKKWRLQGYLIDYAKSMANDTARKRNWEQIKKYTSTYYRMLEQSSTFAYQIQQEFLQRYYPKRYKIMTNRVNNEIYVTVPLKYIQDAERIYKEVPRVFYGSVRLLRPTFHRPGITHMIGSKATEAEQQDINNWTISIAIQVDAIRRENVEVLLAFLTSGVYSEAWGEKYHDNENRFRENYMDKLSIQHQDIILHDEREREKAKILANQEKARIAKSEEERIKRLAQELYPKTRLYTSFQEWNNAENAQNKAISAGTFLVFYDHTNFEQGNGDQPQRAEMWHVEDTSDVVVVYKKEVPKSEWFSEKSDGFLQSIKSSVVELETDFPAMKRKKKQRDNFHRLEKPFSNIRNGYYVSYSGELVKSKAMTIIGIMPLSVTFQEQRTYSPATTAGKYENNTNTTEEGTTYKLIKGIHTMYGYDIWTVQLIQRVDNNTYELLKAQATKNAGRYSTYNKDGAIPGFVFKKEENAHQFIEDAKRSAGLSDDMYVVRRSNAKPYNY